MKKMLCIAFICIISLSVFAENPEHSDKSYWKDGYFIQENVRSDCSSVIEAKLEGKWKAYQLVDLPDEFVDWSVSRRMETFDNVEQGVPPKLSGPHNGIVASWSVQRNDSKFKINNAVKGMGFCPKQEYVKELIRKLKDTKENDFTVKLQVLRDIYKDAGKYFDMRRMVSLELYATEGFETGTFLNQMEYPAVSIVFLDIPSYEVKAIAQMLHPDNPGLTEYQKDIVEYINLIHSYFHGEFSRMFIGVIYNVIEVYDNSPKSKGVRIMPVLP